MAKSTSHPAMESDFDAEAFIAKHKNIILSIVVLIVVGIFVWGYWGSKKAKSNSEWDNKLYTFGQQYEKKWQDDKVDWSKAAQDYLALTRSMPDYAGIIPMALRISDKLNKANKLQSSLELLKRAKAANSTVYGMFLVNLRLARVYEDLNKPQMAIDELEELANSGKKVLEEKVYFDLGRLYKKVGNKEKARLNFQYVIDNMAQHEFARMAKIYLKEL